jgi:hypothetical protein
LAPVVSVLGANWVQDWKCGPYAAKMPTKPGLVREALTADGVKRIL